MSRVQSFPPFDRAPVQLTIALQSPQRWELPRPAPNSIQPLKNNEKWVQNGSRIASRIVAQCRPPWHCPRTVPAPEPGWQPGKAFWGKSIRNTISEDLRRCQKGMLHPKQSMSRFECKSIVQCMKELERRPTKLRVLDIIEDTPVNCPPQPNRFKPVSFCAMSACQILLDPVRSCQLVSCQSFV